MITSKNIESQIFDFSQLDDKWKYNEELKFVHNNPGKTLITNDKQIIDEYFNKLWAFHALAVVHEKLFENEKASAIRLLKNIEHEYKIEN